MHVDDSTTETRWGDYTEAALQRGVLSCVSVPLALEEKPQR